MSIDNITLSKIHSKLSIICKITLDLRRCGFFFSERLGSDCESAVVSEPSVFEPLRVYHSLHYLFCLICLLVSKAVFM